MPAWKVSFANPRGFTRRSHEYYLFFFTPRAESLPTTLHSHKRARVPGHREDAYANSSNESRRFRRVHPVNKAVQPSPVAVVFI